jgi:hypothetical protein
MLYAVFCMLHATCCIMYAICCMLYAICYIFVRFHRKLRCMLEAMSICHVTVSMKRVGGSDGLIVMSQSLIDVTY